MKRILSLLLLPFALFASEVTTDDAARAAKAWVDRGYAMGKLPAGREVSAVDEVEDPATGARLLVAKFEGGGYVVLSADDLVDPVIAFSGTGDGLVVDERNPFWALLRGDISAREAAAGVSRGAAGKRGVAARVRAATTDSEKTDAQRKWAGLLAEESRGPKRRAAVAAPSDLRVDSFVESRWNQDEAGGEPCFNYYTPSNYVCGCVATAGAQIMRYWRWPQSSVAAATRTCAVGGVQVQKTMQGGVYDWDAMPLVPGAGIAQAQRQAIGKLTYDIGVSVGMNWNTAANGGSGSDPFGLVLRFADTFGYANAVAAVFDAGHPFTVAEFAKAVVPNCDARAPVCVGISGSVGGHAVLVDGYGWTDGAFCVHVNLGWGGIGDAWYVPPDIDDFDTIDQLVFNVFPRSSGSVFSGRVLDASGAPVAGATVVLKRGSSTVETATSDANGIYAFVAAAGSYLVTAAKGGVSATIGVTLDATVGTELVPGGVGARRTGSYASIGNTYGNDIALTGVAATPAPVFDPEGCRFYPTTNVTIACSDPSATIRYTLDGSVPTETSTRYTGPLLVEDDVTIRARAFVAGKNPSPVVAETYVYDAAQGAPKGDCFADPIKISGASGTRAIEDVSDYTLEDGEPWHTLDGGSYYDQNRSVWYRWTAPGTGTMTFTAVADEDYPFLAVYEGDSWASGDRLGFSADVAWDSGFTVSLDVPVSQGTVYRIVGMTYGETSPCSFTLSWSGNLTVVKTPYETWADANASGGAPDEVSGGVANAFRYVFGKPSGAFSPILSAAPGASGGTVLRLPPVVNADGVTLKVLSTADVTDWSPSAVSERTVTVGSDGTVELPDGGPARFFRLEAEVE